MEKDLGFQSKVRYLEELGPTLASKLIKKEPDPQTCGRQNCLPCRTKAGVCQRQGVLYKLVCKICTQEGREKQAIYVGESARTPFDRGAEHLKLMEREDPESPAVEHTQEMHPGQETSFSMEVISFPKTTLQRQAMEGHYIGLNEGQNLLNRRGEWGQNLPPKMIVQGQEQVQKKRQVKRQGQGNQSKKVRTSFQRGKPRSKLTTVKVSRRGILAKMNYWPAIQTKRKKGQRTQVKGSKMTKMSSLRIT